MRTWFHELSYAAKVWSGPRRLVLVVIDEPEELFLRHFFLVTNWEPNEYTGEQLLAHYRQRGTMEGHIGELSSALAPALSCTSRRKSHIGGKAPKTRSTPRDGEAANAATFLLYALAYNLSNSLRLIMNAERTKCACSHGADKDSPIDGARVEATDTPAEDSQIEATDAPLDGPPEACGCGHSLSRLQVTLLRVPARFVVSGRRVTMVLANKVADLWRDLWRGLQRLQPLALTPAPSSGSSRWPSPPRPPDQRQPDGTAPPPRNRAVGERGVLCPPSTIDQRWAALAAPAHAEISERTLMNKVGR